MFYTVSIVTLYVLIKTQQGRTHSQICHSFVTFIYEKLNTWSNTDKDRLYDDSSLRIRFDVLPLLVISRFCFRRTGLVESLLLIGYIKRNVGNHISWSIY